MRNFKIIAITLIISTFIISCDDFKDFESERDSVVGITGVIGAAPAIVLPPGGTATREIGVFVSDVVSTDRSFNVVVIAEGSEVGAENYSFDSTVTIPANERRGSFFFTGTDVSLTGDPTPVILAIDNADPSYVSGARVTLTLRRN